MVEITPGDHPDEERAVKSNIVWVSVGCRLSGASGATRPGARRRRAMRRRFVCVCGCAGPGRVGLLVFFRVGLVLGACSVAEAVHFQAGMLENIPRHATFV